MRSELLKLMTTNKIHKSATGRKNFPKYFQPTAAANGQFAGTISSQNHYLGISQIIAKNNSNSSKEENEKNQF